jgi:phosphatidylglycerophosphate synthase
MGLQVVAIFLLLLGRRYPVLQGPAIVTLWLVVAVALVSAADYFQSCWREVVKGGGRTIAEDRSAGERPANVA